MPSEPPRDEEADFLDFLREDGSSDPEEPPGPPKGEEGDLVVLEPGAEAGGEASDDFREAEVAAPEDDEAPGEEFREEVPSAEEAGSDEFLGWLDGAAKDSLEGPQLEEMMTQEMTEMGEDIPKEPAEALLDQDSAEVAVEALLADSSEVPLEGLAEAVEAEVEAEADADLVFGEGPRVVPAGAEEDVEEEAAAEFDEFLSEGAPATPASEEMAASVAETRKSPAAVSGLALFRLEDGTPIPVLPPSLGGYKPPSQSEFVPRRITYPVIRTPTPVSLIILLILIAGAVAAGYFYRDPIKKYAVALWGDYMGPGEVEPTPTGTSTGTVPELEYSCQKCDVLVTETELQTGKAKKIDGKFYCLPCAEKLDKPEPPIPEPGKLFEHWVNGFLYTFLPGDKEKVLNFDSFTRSMQSTGLGRQ